MRHKEIEILIHKKLDREITIEEERMLYDHLNKCADCKEYYLGMEFVQKELLNLTEYFPEGDLNERILSKIRVVKPKVLEKLVPVFWAVYLCTLVSLIFSPIPNRIFSKVLFILPGAVGVLEKIKSIRNGMGLLIVSFLKMNEFEILFALFISLILFYTIGRIQDKLIKKEAR
jgi:hypothetical protein